MFSFDALSILSMRLRKKKKKKKKKEKEKWKKKIFINYHTLFNYNTRLNTALFILLALSCIFL